MRMTGSLSAHKHIISSKNIILVSISPPCNCLLTSSPAPFALFDDRYIAGTTESPMGSIELAKKSVEEGAEGFFDDGLTYLFQQQNSESGEMELTNVRPGHIHFEVMSSFGEGDDLESCDFRFYSVEMKETEAEETTAADTIEDESRRLQDGDEADEPEAPEEEKKEAAIVTASPAGPSELYVKKEFSDVAFFRLGFFGYLKLNTQNMLMPYSSDEWYSVDLILDYDEQRVSIYVNQEPLKSAAFFTQRKEKLDSGNAVSIYGLTPNSKNYFRNIQMCETICEECKYSLYPLCLHMLT